MTASTKKRTAPQKETAAPERPETNPLVRDAEAVAVRAEKPEGMPPLWPLLAMPRRRRASVFRSVAAISSGLQELSGEAMNEDGEVAIDFSKIGVMADFLDLAQDIADLLVESAAPGHEEAMTAWADQAEETALASAFSWYMTTMSPGEAEGS